MNKTNRKMDYLRTSFLKNCKEKLSDRQQTVYTHMERKLDGEKLKEEKWKNYTTTKKKAISIG